MARPPLVLERVLPAPPAEVFRHWCDAGSLAEWMRPAEGMGRASVSLDFRVGGRFEIVMHGERDYRQHGEILEIEPDRRLVFLWISDWMPPGEQRTRLSVSFEPAGTEETRLVLVHDELPESDAYAGHAGGWARILDGLLGSLATRPEESP